MNYEFVLPRAISLNNIYRNYGAKRVRTDRYIKWLSEAKSAMLAQGPRPEFSRPVAVSIDLGIANLRARFDIDNAAKPIMDLLVAMGVLPDDSWQVVRCIRVAALDIDDAVRVEVREVKL